MLSIKNNLQAGNASRQFGINSKESAKLTEKLSSGYRINRSADDAAGLSISEKMRRQIRGLSQASTNSQDGISLVQTAEGALHEVHEMLQRANELTIKAANGTLTDKERCMIDDEIQKMKEAIDGTANNTEFNGIKLFPRNGMSPKSTASSKMYHYDLHIDLSAGTVGVNAANASGGMARAGGDPVNTGSVLADTIGNILVPNAVNQILNAFPSLSGAVGSNTIDMALDVSFIDGPNDTLAYAQFTYSPAGGKPISMGLKVDVADFTDADAQGTGPRAEALESTIAHELMHTVMQYTMTDGMSGRGGEKYPEWFVEGTAQLAGGGFTTGWNNALTGLTSGLASGDASNDAAIGNYLATGGSINGRPYGHGYLAAAYAGYLANGGNGPVTGAAIAAGMDKIFADILSGKTLDAALQAQTGMTSGQVDNLFRNPNQDLIEFVRELSIASQGGAGSVITPTLNVGGSNILGDTPGLNTPFRIDPDLTLVDLDREGPRIILQVGGEAGENLFIRLYQMSSGSLGLYSANTKTREDAVDAINQVRDAIGYVSGVRSAYGAVQNRLEHTIKNLDNTVENTTSSESRIRDTDIAHEMVNYSNQQIILQAGQSMLAQANQQPQSILSLLQ